MFQISPCLLGQAQTAEPIVVSHFSQVILFITPVSDLNYHLIVRTNLMVVNKNAINFIYQLTLFWELLLE